MALYRKVRPTAVLWNLRSGTKNARLMRVGFGIVYPKEETVYVQARESLDALNPQLWHYIGSYLTTQSYLRSIRKELLADINEVYGRNFKRIWII